MAGQSNSHPSTGAPLTTPRNNREFVDQLAAWNFAQRKADGVHLVFRGPHGGTLRVLRSLLGHADPVIVEKAARLAGVTPDRFWAGPVGILPEPEQPERTPLTASSPSREHPVPASVPAAETPRPRRRSDRDRVTALVLGVHAEADRPLGFDQVVELAGTRVTREQVRSASAQLCREGDLERIRSGVYQWSAGARSQVSSPAAAPAPSCPVAATATVTDLFTQLFPSGVRMTAELLADFERWAELTHKLAEHAQAS